MRRSLIAGPCEFLRNCYVNRELSLVSVKIFGEEKPGKVYRRVSKIYPDFLSFFFIFIGFNIRLLILLVKITLI